MLFANKVLLITGSNMSGKSTYLRTVGINLVLAYAGASVCADQFYCDSFNVYTCMRVSDNLEKNTSSFYAELLRIKEIVDIDIPYPRTQETKLTSQFLDIKNRIWAQVYQEYLAVRK